MGRIKYHISKSFLIDKYWDKRMSLKQIADIINCNATTILDLMKKYKIKRRTLSEAETGEYNNQYKDGKCNNNFCIDCGKKITPYAIRCETCFGLYYSGKKHHAYIHGEGQEPYSYRFIKVRKKIRQRDNFTCQSCGIIEEKHLIIYRTILDVHHIDYNKENCKKENLISLCHKCNMRANKNRDYWYAYFMYIMETLT